MKAFYGDLKLGILGGGQLGRMLIQQAINYNVTVKVLDPDREAPCRKLCDEFVVGSLSDYETVYNFGKKADMVTIEIEKVNVDALEQLEKEGVLVYPQPRVIRLIQDKGLQKQFFKENNIPTAEFQVISSPEQLRASHIPFPYIQKLRRDGYDGRGVYKVIDESYLANAFTEPSLIERWIDFEKEIGIIVARSESGEVKTFPMVEMEFNPQVNLVEFLISPSTLPFEVQQDAAQIAAKIAVDLKIVGLLAVEMFLDKHGRILVNELAPRPHNSGHQSIEGNVVSQFEQHLRAIFNQPLGDTACLNNAIMVNVLGEAGYEGPAIYKGIEKVLKCPGVYVHLYGKALTKPFRKMGHVTIVDADREKAIEKARFVQETLEGYCLIYILPFAASNSPILEIKLYKSKWKAATFLLLASVFVAGGLFIVFKSNGNKVIGWICTCFFGLGLPLGIFNLFDNRPQIIINETGIFDRAAYTDFVNWNLIKDVYEKEAYRQVFICLVLDEKAIPLLKGSKAGREFSKDLDFEEINLSLGQLTKVDTEKFVEFIKAMTNADPSAKRALLLEADITI